MSGITIVNSYEKVAVLRWGKYRGSLSQGFHWIWPIMERGIRMDLRERIDRVPTQQYITNDNVVINMDFVIYYRVLADEAHRSVLEVGNFVSAVINLAIATLRAHVGTITLAQALAERQKIRDTIQIRLDETTPRWGIKVNQVEINEIDPPEQVKQAMDRQKSADAIKVADITESEGQREAAINKAEGEKRALVLTAEGGKDAEVLAAEGKKKALLLEAEGFSSALNKIDDIAQNVNKKTMALQYFDTLKDLGAGESTKWIFPLELTSIIRPFGKPEDVEEGK